MVLQSDAPMRAGKSIGVFVCKALTDGYRADKIPPAQMASTLTTEK